MWKNAVLIYPITIEHNTHSNSVRYTHLREMGGGGEMINVTNGFTSINIHLLGKIMKRNGKCDHSEGLQPENQEERSYQLLIKTLDLYGKCPIHPVPMATQSSSASSQDGLTSSLLCNTICKCVCLLYHTCLNGNTNRHIHVHNFLCYRFSKAQLLKPFFGEIWNISENGNSSSRITISWILSTILGYTAFRRERKMACSNQRWAAYAQCPAWVLSVASVSK